jgi:hypothetical protein
MKSRIRKSAVALLRRHLKDNERGTALFRRSTALLNRAMEAGLPLDEPIDLGDGKLVCLRDQFSGRNEAFAAKIFHRFKVEAWKEPKAAKVKEAAVASEAEAVPVAA